MARPRVPKAKVEVTGPLARNPARFRNRREPKVQSLGRAPLWMDASQQEVWTQFAHALPWLNASHRALLGIAVGIRARLIACEPVDVQALNLLRLCLGAMGGTPADASRVTMPADDEEDPADAYFTRPNLSPWMPIAWPILNAASASLRLQPSGAEPPARPPTACAPRPSGRDGCK